MRLREFAPSLAGPPRGNAEIDPLRTVLLIILSMLTSVSPSSPGRYSSAWATEMEGRETSRHKPVTRVASGFRGWREGRGEKRG